VEQLQPWFSAVTRALVFVAGTVTTLCASAIIAFQLASGLANGNWNSVPIFQIMEIIDSNIETTYTMASADAQTSHALSVGSVLGSMRDVPAIIPLFIALGLLVAFYALLASLHKARSRV